MTRRARGLARANDRQERKRAIHLPLPPGEKAHCLITCKSAPVPCVCVCLASISYSIHTRALLLPPLVRGKFLGVAENFIIVNRLPEALVSQTFTVKLSLFLSLSLSVSLCLSVSPAISVFVRYIYSLRFSQRERDGPIFRTFSMSSSPQFKTKNESSFEILTRRTTLKEPHTQVPNDSLYLNKIVYQAPLRGATSAYIFDRFTTHVAYRAC